MWYLCVFFHRLLDYRKAEVESLAQLFSNEDQEYQCLQWRLPLLHHPDSPFHFVNLPSEDVAKSIANRSQYFFSSISSFSHLQFLLTGLEFLKSVICSNRNHCNLIFPIMACKILYFIDPHWAEHFTKIWAFNLVYGRHTCERNVWTLGRRR